MYDKPIKVKKDKTLKYEYFYDPKHPLAARNGRVWYHRHVLSIRLGRWLLPTEVVHHKDGRRDNNDPDNLELEENHAKHCVVHALQFGKQLTKIERVCPHCGEKWTAVRSITMYCSSVCAISASRAFEFPADVLESLVWSQPTSTVSRVLGVSDTAVAKRCKKFGILKPPRGYWMKALVRAEPGPGVRSR